MASGEPQLIEFEGELFSSIWQMKWVEVGGTVKAGNLIVPIEVPTGDQTLEHAALHLAIDDLELAKASFAEAANQGIPDSANLLGRALIHAGVMAYARSFSGGVRGFRLSTAFFASTWTASDAELHDYLYALRDKHVAHSVNDFERSTTVGVVVADPAFKLVDTNPSGIGVTKMSMVGLPLHKLKDCSAHIERMTSQIDQRITELTASLHAAMRSTLVVGQMVHPAPIATLPDRAKISERRR